MTNFKIILVIIFFLCVKKADAYTPKEGNVTAQLGPFLTKTDFKESSTGPQNPLLGGIGLVATGDLNTRGALEIAMFYMEKIYFRDINRQYISEKTQLMHITMGYRRWLSPSFSASLAFSSSYGLGDPSTVYSDYALGTAIDTSAQDFAEYGADLALQTELYARDKWAVVLDARYAFSFTNKTSESGHHYGILLGIRYLVQDRIPEKSPHQQHSEEFLKEGQTVPTDKPLKSE